MPSAGGGQARLHGRRKLWLLLAALVLAWSLNYIFGKTAIAGFTAASNQPATAVVMVRMLIALAGLLIAPLLCSGWRVERVSARDFAFLALLGATGITANQYCFVVGLGKTSVAHASLMIALTPLVVLLMAAAAGQERITARKAAGMAIALGGVALLLTGAVRGTATLIGDLIVFGATASFAFYTVASKSVVGRFSTFGLNYYVYLLGTLFMLPVGGPLLRALHPGAITAMGWLSVLYMGLVGSIAAYLIYFEVMRSLSASEVAALSYLQPVVASAIGVLVFPAERITAGLLAGGAVILAGVWMCES
jgi:drug/metabolite transporter (DMT)-like permease